jgi:hypothetical protein
MIRRPSKPTLTMRATGHAFGVLGAVMGLNAIATSIDPRYLSFFPFADSGVEQTPAALISVGLIALAMWMVAERTARAKAKIDPPELP